MEEFPNMKVTTECPTCHQSWTRMVYDLMPWGAVALTMCDECTKKNTDLDGNAIIQMPSCKYRNLSAR